MSAPRPWSWEEQELSEGFACVVYDASGQALRPLYLSREDAATIAAAPELLAALLLHDAYLAVPQDRGGPNGPKGRAHQAWLDAKTAALAKAQQVAS